MDIVTQIFGGVIIFMSLFLFWMCFCFGNCVKRRQKTRSTQQRRMYSGTRTRQLSIQGEPPIYVSPANLPPPPPKYEAMAPPSYDEVMGVQYPGYRQGQQPITQPITHAMTQGSSNTDIPAVHTVTNTTNTDNVNTRSTEIGTDAPTIVVVTDEERRTPVSIRA